jgi:hypothetical protein
MGPEVASPTGTRRVCVKIGGWGRCVSQAIAEAVPIAICLGAPEYQPLIPAAAPGSFLLVWLKFRGQPRRIFLLR